MKKKLTALCLVAGLIALMVAGSTLAFFKDTDDAVNVFTVGNVDILLHEDNDAAKNTGEDYMLDADYENWVKKQDFLPTVTLEKDAWIENIGSEDAYVRMYIVYPTDVAPMLDIKYDAGLDANWADATNNGTAIDSITYTIDGVEYTARCLVYKKVLEAGDNTTDTITSVTLKSAVECETLADGTIKYVLGNDSYISAEGNFPVFVIAQAGQVTNQLDANDPEYWDNANDALNIMFGVPGADGLFDEVAVASTQEELAAAISTAQAGETVLLTNGEYELKGSQKDGVIIKGVGNVKISNLTNFAGNGNLGAIWQNMTFENVTFTEKVYTMADGAQSVFKNCTFEQGFRGSYSKGVEFYDCTFYDNSEGFAAHFETVYTTALFDNCSFVEGTVAFGDGNDNVGVVTFNDCTFSGVSTRTEKVDAWADAVFNNCTFETATEIWVRTDSTGPNAGTKTVTLNNTTGATTVTK